MSKFPNRKSPKESDLYSDKIFHYTCNPGDYYEYFTWIHDFKNNLDEIYERYSYQVLSKFYWLCESAALLKRLSEFNLDNERWEDDHAWFYLERYFRGDLEKLRSIYLIVYNDEKFHVFTYRELEEKPESLSYDYDNGKEVVIPAFYEAPFNSFCKLELQNP